MRQPWRLGERGERWLDIGLAGFLILPVLLLAPLGVFSPAMAVVTFVQVAPLFWRRRHPVPVAAVVALGALAQVAVTDLPSWGQLAAPIAIYSVARFSTGLWGRMALAAGLAGAVIAPWDWVGEETFGWTAAHFPYFLTISAIVLASWALGTTGRIRTAFVASLIERGERLEHEAEQREQLAAQDERARIAREMHDVVAHGLSVMVVQADGARYAAAKDPHLATAALETISETGREALTEMRRMLGLLRSDEESGTAPQPGLSDLGHLIQAARAGGMRLSTSMPDPLPRVADGIGLTIYRIAQESLTNVRKHAGPDAVVRLTLGFEEHWVTLEITDNGRGTASTDDGRGLGLVGMRERVAVHGGSLTSTPAVGGGFTISARIPL